VPAVVPVQCGRKSLPPVPAVPCCRAELKTSASGAERAVRWGERPAHVLWCQRCRAVCRRARGSAGSGAVQCAEEELPPVQQCRACRPEELTSASSGAVAGVLGRKSHCPQCQAVPCCAPEERAGRQQWCRCSVLGEGPLPQCQQCRAAGARELVRASQWCRRCCLGRKGRADASSRAVRQKEPKFDATVVIAVRCAGEEPLPQCQQCRAVRQRAEASASSGAVQCA
jgi:hypothetical protein